MKATQSNITKKEIVDEIASQTGFTQVKTKVIVEELIDAISNCIQKVMSLSSTMPVQR